MFKVLGLIRVYDRKDKNLRKIILSSEETILIDFSKEDERLFKIYSLNKMNQDLSLYVLLIMYLIVFIICFVVYILPPISLHRNITNLIGIPLSTFFISTLYYKYHEAYISELLSFMYEKYLTYQITRTKQSWLRLLYIKTILLFIVLLCLVIYGWTLKGLEPKIILGIVFIIPNYLFTIYLSNVLLFSKYKKNVDKFMESINNRS